MPYTLCASFHLFFISVFTGRFSPLLPATSALLISSIIAPLSLSPSPFMRLLFNLSTLVHLWLTCIAHALTFFTFFLFFSSPWYSLNGDSVKLSIHIHRTHSPLGYWSSLSFITGHLKLHFRMHYWNERRCINLICTPVSSSPNSTHTYTVDHSRC